MSIYIQTNGILSASFSASFFWQDVMVICFLVTKKICCGNFMLIKDQGQSPPLSKPKRTDSSAPPIGFLPVLSVFDQSYNPYRKAFRQAISKDSSKILLSFSFHTSLLLRFRIIYLTSMPILRAVP